jgi:hypothetical protein
MFNAEKLCREDAGRLGFRVEAFAPLSGNNSQGRDTKKTERGTEMAVMLKCPKQSLSAK